MFLLLLLCGSLISASTSRAQIDAVKNIASQVYQAISKTDSFFKTANLDPEYDLDFASRRLVKASEILYPDDLLNDGVIDVTKAPYFADNTGKKDSTEVLRSAYNYVANSDKQKSIVYLPNGVYKVSDTVVYTGQVKTCRNQGRKCIGEYNTKIRIIGQHQHKTIVKLVNNAHGFQNPRFPKAVISLVRMANGTATNTPSGNIVRNLTINVGSGNDGAVGLRFHATNNGGVRDVTIKTSDSNRSGSIGLLLPHNKAQGLFKNVTVEGFNIGISHPYGNQSTVAFENLALFNQKVAGFRVVNGPASINRLTSFNKVPAVQVTGKDGHVVLTNSNLLGGSKNEPAIDVSSGALFVRNIITSGYDSAIKQGNVVVQAGPKVVEYVTSKSKDPLKYQQFESLELPIKETPHISWETDFSRWRSVNYYGAKGNGSSDDTEAIQKAMNSGKPVIYFKPGKYVVSSTIMIPASVKRINFMFADLKGKQSLFNSSNGAFKIIGNSSNPLLIEDLFVWTSFSGKGMHAIFEHASERTVIMRNIHAQSGPMYFNSVSGGQVYLENVSNRLNNKSQRPNFDFNGQQVWARWLNPERWYNPNDRASPAVINRGRGKLWILGFKHEGGRTFLEAKQESKSEILGGVGSNHSPLIPKDLPFILNNESDISLVAHTAGRADDHHYWYTLVKETKNGISHQLKIEELPKRGLNRVFIPLYSSYKACKVNCVNNESRQLRPLYRN
jgi:hypothetical protein